MNMTFILAMLRHALTFGGGFLASRGIVDSATVEVVSGAILTIVGAVWSVVEKKQRIE